MPEPWTERTEDEDVQLPDALEEWHDSDNFSDEDEYQITESDLEDAETCI